MNAAACASAVFSPAGGTEKTAPMRLAVDTLLKAGAGKPKRPALFM